MSNIHIYSASSLNEVHSTINQIAHLEENENQPLWFKGMENYHYNLIPSRYRKKLKMENLVNDGSYGFYNQFDEMQYMVFKTRAASNLTSNLQNMTEWMELLEYHAGDTGMIKFSDHMNVGLNWALRPYFNPKNGLTEQEIRRVSTPVLWVLNPAKLNQHVYDFFKNEHNVSTIAYALEEFYPEQNWARHSPLLERKRFSEMIQEELKTYQSLYFANNNNFMDMEQVISLNALNDMRNENASRMHSLLMNHEFNPFYYLLLRFYQDSIPYRLLDEEWILPPMATILPYFNERIRVHHGTFVVAPNYILSDEMVELKTITGIDYRAMDYQKICEDCIYKIQLLRPDHIARELMIGGQRFTDIEPDLYSYVKLMKANKEY